MDELLRTQTCPYCGHEVDDHQAVWDEDGEEVECDKCKREYMVKPQYKFEGFQIEKQCEDCGQWTDDGYVLCDCNEDEHD